MSVQEQKSYEGHSDVNFTQAAQDAVRRYEEDNGVPGEPVTMRVIEMTVTFNNPIRDYSVTIG